MKLRIGVIGTGVIGGGMVRRALAEGHEVGVFDLRAEVLEELAAVGARPASSSADLAAHCDTVVISLPRAEDVEKACFAAAGLLEGLRPGMVVIDSSTTPPAGMEKLRQAVTARGAHLIDAPLCPSQNRELQFRPIPTRPGSFNAAGYASEAGNLCFFVGGDTADVALARPVLEVLGLEFHHVGPLGSGKLVKLLHNAINITALAAISEAMLVAKRNDLDLRVVTEALMTSLADSAMLRQQGRKFIAEQHFPKGLFPLHFSVKDLGYALDCARAVGVVPSVTGATHALYTRAAASPYGDYYNPAIFRFIEDEAST